MNAWSVRKDILFPENAEAAKTTWANAKNVDSVRANAQDQVSRAVAERYRLQGIQATSRDLNRLVTKVLSGMHATNTSAELFKYLDTALEKDVWTSLRLHIYKQDVSVEQFDLNNLLHVFHVALSGYLKNNPRNSSTSISVAPQNFVPGEYFIPLNLLGNGEIGYVELLSEKPGEVETASTVATLAEYRLHAKLSEEQSRAKIVMLEEASRTDALTKVLNRRGLYDGILVELETMEENAHISFLILDIDHFKITNDRFGHDSGDVVLKDFASSTKQVLQRYGGKSIFGRHGGEEFCIVLPGANSAMAMEVAESILQATRAIDITHHDPDGGSTRIDTTVSIGVYSTTEKHDDPGKYIHRADRAMYASKNSGRDRATAYVAGLPMNPGSKTRSSDS